MAHPILTAVASIDEALKSVADVNPTFMSTDDKGVALRELVRAESELAELRLRVLADAGDLAEKTAARDAAQWLASATRTRPEDARADLALAHALDRRWHALAHALREGEVTVAQAAVIARTLDQLPDELEREVLARAEETLIGYAAQFGPRQLATLGRRIVHTVAPEIADEIEARRLAALEEAAHRRTRLSMRRLGDGTTRLAGILPDGVADRALTYLEAFTNPRKEQADPASGRGFAADAVARLGSYPRRLGRAFCQFLEAVDPTRLPVHSGDATTVIVTLSIDDLRAELATADLLGASRLPGDDAPQQLSASEIRRLACTAAIIPAVLGGDSELLDLGRSRRLFSPAQRKGLLLRDQQCRAEGCDVPGEWCEAHHWHPWATGGRTDIAVGVLLCHHHHRRIHDACYAGERLPNGDVRFTRRT